MLTAPIELISNWRVGRGRRGHAASHGMEQQAGVRVIQYKYRTHRALTGLVL